MRHNRVLSGMSLLLIIILLVPTLQVSAQDRCEGMEEIPFPNEHVTMCEREDGHIVISTDTVTTCHITWSLPTDENPDILSDDMVQERALGENANCSIPWDFNPVDWIPNGEGECASPYEECSYRLWIVFQQDGWTAEGAIDITHFGRTTEALVLTVNQPRENGGVERHTMTVPVGARFRTLGWPTVDGWFVHILDANLIVELPFQMAEFADQSVSVLQRYDNQCVAQPVEPVANDINIDDLNVEDLMDAEHLVGLAFPQVPNLEQTEFTLWFDGQQIDMNPQDWAIDFTLAIREQYVYLPSLWVIRHLFPQFPPTWRQLSAWRLEFDCDEAIFFEGVQNLGNYVYVTDQPEDSSQESGESFDEVDLMKIRFRWYMFWKHFPLPDMSQLIG